MNLHDFLSTCNYSDYIDIFFVGESEPIMPVMARSPGACLGMLPSALLSHTVVGFDCVTQRNEKGTVIGACLVIEIIR